MTVVVGRNGVGKTTFFDVFGFLHDCLDKNVRKALDMRGGYREVVSRGKSGEPIELTIKFRPDPTHPRVTYVLQIGEVNGRPSVTKEQLLFRRGERGRGALWKMLDFSNGKGSAVAGEPKTREDVKGEKRVEQKLDSPDILAIKGMGQFSDFPAIASFRKMIEGWTVSDFRISAAREIQDSVASERLSKTGDNLSQVAMYLYESHRPAFDEIICKMRSRIPGIDAVEAVPTIDNRLALRFQDGAFKDPFLAKYASDGTMRMFAYLVLLSDPEPCSLLCVEEPENQLYPEILTALAEEFREYGRRGQL